MRTPRVHTFGPNQVLFQNLESGLVMTWRASKLVHILVHTDLTSGRFWWSLVSIGDPPHLIVSNSR